MSPSQLWTDRIWSPCVIAVIKRMKIAMSMKDTHDIASLRIVHKLVVDVVLSVATHGYCASIYYILGVQKEILPPFTNIRCFSFL
jgi:hypothetical protein